MEKAIETVSVDFQANMQVAQKESILHHNARSHPPLSKLSSIEHVK